MTALENERSRPAGNGPAKESLDDSSTSVSVRHHFAGLTLDQSRLIHNWIADGNGLPAKSIAFVAVVTTTGGKYQRRAYFNLPSAQAAVERAEARGCAARIVLCRLVPVDGGL